MTQGFPGAGNQIVAVGAGGGLLGAIGQLALQQFRQGEGNTFLSRGFNAARKECTCVCDPCRCPTLVDSAGDRYSGHSGLLPDWSFSPL